MKAYGYSRRDKLTCRHGCCDCKGSKYKNSRPFVDKAKRKTARRFVCDAIYEEWVEVLF
jgi:hypothetical protein